MLITVFIYATVISFSTAFLDLHIFSRRKRSLEAVPCERGWYYFQEKCYKIFARKSSERLPWNRASERCKSFGAELASIHSQAEQDFIVSFLQLDVKSWLWIGLNDREKEGYYKWTDGSAFNYMNWKRGEPSVKGPLNEEEDCVYMVFEPEPEHNIIGKWNDRDCDTPETYVCEKNPNHIRRSPNILQCSSEGGGGLKWKDSCYHVVSEKKSWQNAEKHCKRNYNGHLVDVLDMLEDFFLDYVAADVKDDLWIGIKTKFQLQQKWSSEWYVSYDGFHKEHANFREGTCVARKERKEWTTIPCTTQLPFVCEVSKLSPIVLKPGPEGSHCPVEFDEWRDLGGEYCYYFEKEKTLSFYEALFDCKRRGGSLASLHSKEESDMLLSFVKYIRFRSFVFIGLFRLMGRDEEFAWTDGSPFDFENWKVNEPNNLDDKCVEALTHDDAEGVMFSWNDVNCGEKRGYICSVKKVLPNSPFDEDGDCTSFCVPQSSYLHGLVSQSSEVKRCKTRCQT